MNVKSVVSSIIVCSDISSQHIEACLTSNQNSTAKLFFRKQPPPSKKEKEKKRERGKHSFKKERCKRILCAHFQNLKGKMQCKYWQFQLFYPSNVLSALMINDVLFVFCGLFGDFCLFLVMMKISANKQLQHGRCKTRHF